MTVDQQRRLLESGLAALNIEMSRAQIAKLQRFLDVLVRWNRVYPLTSVRSSEQMVVRHLLDSLSIVSYVDGPNVLDVGSGAGIPGIPLAVARPECRFVLLDSHGKKTRFITHAAGQLDLANVKVARARVEDYAVEIGFDTVISRAFSSLGEFASLAGHLCGRTGCLLAMKGRLRSAERDALPAGWRVGEIHRLVVPGLEAQRHLVLLKRVPETAEQ